MTKKIEFKTKGEARVAIAKDVIKWLNAGKMTATGYSGYLSESDGNLIFTEEDFADNSDLKSTLSEVSCDVCALGAVFLTTLDRFNEVGCRDLIGELPVPAWGVTGARMSLTRNEVTQYLNKYFTTVQMNMIESAYERGGTYIGSPSITAQRKIDKAVKYGEALVEDGVHKAADRLRTIMKNIIKNNGTFKP